MRLVRLWDYYFRSFQKRRRGVAVRNLGELLINDSFVSVEYAALRRMTRLFSDPISALMERFMYQPIYWLLTQLEIEKMLRELHIQVRIK